MNTNTLFDAPNQGAPPVEPMRQAIAAHMAASGTAPKQNKIASKEERIIREREQLEGRLKAHELDDVRTRVAYVLNQYPLHCAARRG